MTAINPALRGRIWQAALLAVCAVLLAPLLLVDVPPLLDYPNHLARAYLLARAGHIPSLAAIYSPHWAIIPNLGTDLVLPPLLHVVPVNVAGRIVIGVALLLPVLGTVAYSRAVFGVRSWWPLGSALVAYNAALLSGFLDFIAAIGLALLLAAGWIRWRDARPAWTVVLSAIGIVGLFFCHLMGLVFYVVLIGAFEAEQVWQQARAGEAPWRAILRRAGPLLPLLVGPVILYAQSDLVGANWSAQWLGIREKLAQLLIPVVNYDLPLDVVTACLTAGFVAACAAMRRVRIPMRSGLAIAALGVLYLAAPFKFKGTAALDQRFAIMLGFMVFGAVLPMLRPRVAPLAAVAFASLFAVRMAVLASAWHGHARDLAELRRVIADVPAGSRVYLASVTPADAAPYWQHGPRARLLSDGTQTDWHMAALLVIERHAFWPFLFAQAAQQPIKVAPLYRTLAMQTLLFSNRAFVATCRAAPEDLRALDAALCGYDDVLLLHAGALAHPRRCGAGRLVLHARSDMAALFAVKAGRANYPGASDGLAQN